MKPEPMTRDEWFGTTKALKLRLMNNVIADISRSSQNLNDIFRILEEENPGMGVSDRYWLVEKQVRIISLEASRLWECFRRFESMLTPEFTDMNYTPALKEPEAKNE